VHDFRIMMLLIGL